MSGAASIQGLSRASRGLLGFGLLWLSGCAFPTEGGSDLSRVNAFGAAVVRGSVGGRLEAEFEAGQELYSRAYAAGLVAAEILVVVNDAEQETVEVHLRLANQTAGPLAVDPAMVRLLYRERELPAVDVALWPDPEQGSIPAGFSRLMAWSFALGEETNSGIHELRLDLPLGEPLRLPIKVPGLF